MSQTSREIMIRALTFDYPERVPWDLGILPYAQQCYPETVEQLHYRFPLDCSGPKDPGCPSLREKGDKYAIGTYIDPWGCVFENVHGGIIGEVRLPIIPDINDWKKIKPPYEILPQDWQKARDNVARDCSISDKFMRGGMVKLWERYQFLRGSTNAFMDIAFPEEGASNLLKVIHDFNMKYLDFWTSTDVDAIHISDDWGSQESLLVSPALWRELFKPFYKDYCDLAHSRGKFVTMHSCGHISAILDDLIEIGVNSINCQLFCMDMEELARKGKGKILFWGDIDRQHVLVSDNPQVGRDAVRKVAEHLYDPAGGIVAYFEFGPGVNPNTAMVIFDEWEKIQAKFH